MTTQFEGPRDRGDRRLARAVDERQEASTIGGQRNRVGARLRRGHATRFGFDPAQAAVRVAARRRRARLLARSRYADAGARSRAEERDPACQQAAVIQNSR